MAKYEFLIAKEDGKCSGARNPLFFGEVRHSSFFLRDYLDLRATADSIEELASKLVSFGKFQLDETRGDRVGRLHTQNYQGLDTQVVSKDELGLFYRAISKQTELQKELLREERVAYEERWDW